MAKNNRSEHYDWDKLRLQYVEGIMKDGVLHYPTVRELCQSLDPPGNEAYMSVRAAKEKWREKRTLHQQTLRETLSEKRTEVLVDEATKLDSDILEAVRHGVSHINAHFEKAKASLAGESKIPMSDSKLNSLAQALQKFQAVGRLVFGESTQNINVNSWLDIAKKAMEEATAEEKNAAG